MTIEVEKPFSFIIELHECIREIKKFESWAARHELEFCLDFIENLQCAGIIDEIMRAACMYPRSKRLSADTVEELSYVISDCCGNDIHTRIPTEELELISALTTNIGRVMVSRLDAAGFYDDRPRYPRLAANNKDYESDAVTQIECNEIRLGVYRIDVVHHAWDAEPIKTEPYVRNSI